MLKGQLVSLDSIRSSDAETLFEWINDPDLVRSNAPFSPVHYARHEDWMRSLSGRKDLALFAIRVGDDLVGSCQLFDIDPVHRSAELQIRIGKSTARARGYGTDAVKTLLRFAKEDLGLHTVWLRVFHNNPAAIRCYEKAGMGVCGKLREAAFVGGNWLDIVVMHI